MNSFLGLGIIAAAAIAVVRPPRPKAGVGKYYLPEVPPMDAAMSRRVDEHNLTDAALTADEAELEDDWAAFCEEHSAKFQALVNAARADAAKLLKRRQSILESRGKMGENLIELLRDAAEPYRQDIHDAETTAEKMRGEVDARLRKAGINEDACPASANPYAAPDAVAFQWRQRLDREPEVERAIVALNRAKSALELLKSRQAIPLTSYRETVRLAPVGDQRFMAAVLE